MKRIFMREKAYGNWFEFLSVLATDKRYYVGDNVICISLKDKSVSSSNEYIAQDQLEGLVYVDEYRDKEAFDYVEAYLQGGDDAHLDVMVDRLIENGFDPMDCPYEEVVRMWG